ncbi:heterokaryon incompatibility protein-domain-containing protein [Suillus clintonianus]|uniref:heterokaryon incompatibility protein-domain-containing protein n=1 Tax=Suillus clintonianus TaxID=1904413 RepID=UPI001B85B9B7|nr:heterokaryon incompatibility protein-domain-containing protein [Suillus clintonianus]KAG2129759.1 heterokaryon incompatibility protein-domain-containing protein [Suillus clintonianus]
METSTQFRYQPLPTSSSIRLLRIREFVSTLDYDLVEVDLETNPVYDALSYTWHLKEQSSTTSGVDSECGGSINCNGMKLDVTANLRDGLLRLEHLRQNTLIWIDAICINQQDLEERSAQVNMMGRIFHSARTVVVWLGEPRSGPNVQTVEETIKFMERLPRIKERQSESVSDYEATAVAALREMALTTHTSDWLCLGEFFYRSWFKRCWIIQETVLASIIEVYYGPTYIPWALLQNAARLLDVARRLSFYSQLWREQKMAIFGSIPMILLAREYYHRGKLWRLETHLALSRTYQVTDQRDKIYALLGISDRSSLESPVVELSTFNADYTKSIEQVYTECTVHLVEGQAGLSVLSMVEARSYPAPRPIPSWVPDFSVPPNPPPLAIHGECPFSAGGSAGPRPTVSPDRKELHLPAAVRLGRISRTSETGEEIYSLERMTHFFRLLADPALRLAKPATPAAAEALWRTLIGDLAEDQHPAPASLGVSFNQWVTYLVIRALDTASHASTHAADHFPDGESPPEPIPIFNSSVHRARLEVTRRFAGTFLRMCSARRVFSTEQGGLGIAHQGARVGDEVVIVPGAAVPFVVREIESGVYVLIGEAFVHGVMDGEALEGKDPLDLKGLRVV